MNWLNQIKQLMNHKILFILFFLGVLQLFAQTDTNEKKSIKIPARETEKGYDFNQTGYKAKLQIRNYKYRQEFRWN